MEQKSSDVVTPLRAHEFDEVMSPFDLSSKGAVAISVSGGPDSMALAYCLQRWAVKHQITLQALIVDHALRPESGDEARQTAVTLQQLEIPAEILRWHHDGVTSALHVTARQARYGLMQQACKRIGVHHLFLAHHRDDQAETILMRFAKGSGLDGLIGMAKKSALDTELSLIRPFLDIPKSRLVATCEAAGIPYVRDPSNDSEKYARGRLRAVMPHLAAEGLTVDRLIDLGDRAAEAVAALDFYTHDFLMRETSCDKAAAIHINLSAYEKLPLAIAARVLVAALQYVHAETYQPERESLRRLIAVILNPEQPSGWTLQGCYISRTTKQISIMREVSLIPSMDLAELDARTVWDKRWRIMIPPDYSRQGVSVRPLGNPPHQDVDKLCPALREIIPSGRIRATLPSLWLSNALIDIPNICPVDNSGGVTAKLYKIWPVDF